MSVARVARGAHRLVDLGHGRHPGRDDHRLAGRGDLADQRQVGDLEAGDLVGGRAELLEEVDRGLVERAGEAVDA